MAGGYYNMLYDTMLQYVRNPSDIGNTRMYQYYRMLSNPENRILSQNVLYSIQDKDIFWDMYCMRLEFPMMVIFLVEIMYFSLWYSFP